MLPNLILDSSLLNFNISISHHSGSELTEIKPSSFIDGDFSEYNLPYTIIKGTGTDNLRCCRVSVNSIPMVACNPTIRVSKYYVKIIPYNYGSKNKLTFLLKGISEVTVCAKKIDDYDNVFEIEIHFKHCG